MSITRGTVELTVVRYMYTFIINREYVQMAASSSDRQGLQPSFDTAPSEGPDGGPLGAMKKRSVVITGHRTSVSLENAFWDALKAIAARRNFTVNQLVTEIDKQREGNLSSAIRVYVLTSLQTDLANARGMGQPSGQPSTTEPL
jgi:predicted DNA-binding ribbon-helix-helix protein